MNLFSFFKKTAKVFISKKKVGNNHLVITNPHFFDVPYAELFNPGWK